MGEIKSTLDLVMEKTRHLTLSNEEKQQQKFDEARKRIKGLLQKYQEHILDIDQIKQELNALQKTCESSVSNIFLHEALAELKLDEDNSFLFILLDKVSGIDTNGLRGILDKYQEDIDLTTRQMTDKAKSSLATDMKISGPAVVPNLENHIQWKTEIQKIKHTYEAALKKEKAKLAA